MHSYVVIYLIIASPCLLIRNIPAAAGWGHRRVVGREHSRVPSWASPAEMAAASFAHLWHLVLGIAVQQNSSCLGRVAAPAWAWSRVHGG